MLVTATAAASQLGDWASAGGQCACAAAGATSGGQQLGSTSTSDVISEDWFLRFSDYRLEDYYAVQARLDNDAARPFPTVPASTPPDHMTDLGEPERPQGKLECGPMPSAMAALPNIGGALCSTPQSFR